MFLLWQNLHFFHFLMQSKTYVGQHQDEETAIDHPVNIISKIRTVLLIAKELYGTVIPQYQSCDLWAKEVHSIFMLLLGRIDMILVNLNSLFGNRYQKGR